MLESNFVELTEKKEREDKFWLNQGQSSLIKNLKLKLMFLIKMKVAGILLFLKIIDLNFILEQQM